MPSPLAHSAMGYLVYRISRRRNTNIHIDPEKRGFSHSWQLRLLLWSIFFSLAPDLDAIPGLLLRDFSRYHNQASHSLLVGLAVGLVVLFTTRHSREKWQWFWIAVAGYNLHIVMDFFTGGRGVMFFWPFSSQRFISPIELFFGVRWSDGLWSSAHLVTAATELAFVGLVLLVSHILTRGSGSI